MNATVTLPAYHYALLSLFLGVVLFEKAAPVHFLGYKMMKGEPCLAPTTRAYPNSICHKGVPR